MRWAALLRGVNVGGNRTLPMADLKSFFDALGFGAVGTLLASGNVVFTADETDAATIETRLERAAAARLGLETDFLLRSAPEIAAVIAANPFPDAADRHPNHLLVVFHRTPIDPALIEALDHDGPERLAAAARELYIDYPKGIGRSLLPRAMARSRFPRCATGRNWNTLTRIAEAL